MNFLSHYYFERYSHDPELVMGSILPDLIKNASKVINVYPKKYEDNFEANPKLKSLYRGWLRHMETDRIFHNSKFFYQKTHELKMLLTPAIKDTAIRPSFFSHIALELLLDHLLLHNNWVHETDFYEYLAAADREAVDSFLKLCGIQDTGFFFRYFNSFMRAQYIGAYRTPHQITSALINICRRLWDVELSAGEKQQITDSLISYTSALSLQYKLIFEEIREQLP